MDYHSHPRITLTWVPEGKQKRERFRNMGSSSIGCRGQDGLETESLRPNSPLGERINDDDDDGFCQVGAKAS